MKDKNALFLMQAIGELSEETVAEAKRPAAIRLRNLAAAVAAVVVAVFITAALITASAPDEPEQMVHVEQGGSAYLDKPATPDQIGEIATQPPTEAPTEAPTEPTELTQTETTAQSAVYSPVEPEKPTAAPEEPTALDKLLVSTARGEIAAGGTSVPFEEVGNIAYYRDSEVFYRHVVLMSSLDQLKEFCREFELEYGPEYPFGFVFPAEEGEDSYWADDPSTFDFDKWSLLAVVSTVEDGISWWPQRITRLQNRLYIECVPGTFYANFLPEFKYSPYLFDIVTYCIDKEYLRGIQSLY